MENPGNRLSKKTLFAYGCGDFASNLCWTFVGSYLSVFYTDVVGMAPAIASMIMLIAKIWDGVNDPMFGMIAERTNSKKGRFRPYIFYGAPFLALFSVLTFTTFGKGSAAVGWAAFSYIGCGMLYTVVNLSYGSLSTVMTTNAEDIAQLVTEEKIAAVTTGAGNPEKYMAQWKAAGIKVIPVIASVALAKRMERVGADAVVAEGTESGGHIGQATTMTLVPQVVDAVQIPVIAAGGIGDG